MYDGVRYSHLLSPKAGWPIANAAASITVAADTRVQARMLSTLAMLKGAKAEAFLLAQTERHWLRRDP
jgi:thiamine biosynthesis lipoprotein